MHLPPPDATSMPPHPRGTPHPTPGVGAPHGAVAPDTGFVQPERPLRAPPPLQLFSQAIRGPGPVLTGGIWFLASGMLLIAGVGVLLTAVALCTGDAWPMGGAQRLDEAPTASGGAPLTSAAPQARRGGRPDGPLGAPITLLLTANAAITEHHVFWLQEPRRLVVDMMGVGEAVAAPVTSPVHPLVKRVRWGRHDDRVRFVIEVAPEAHHHVEAAKDGATLAVTLYAQEASP